MTKGSGLQSGRACLAGRIIALRCPFFQHKMSGSQKTGARLPQPGGGASALCAFSSHSRTPRRTHEKSLLKVRRASTEAQVISVCTQAKTRAGKRKAEQGRSSSSSAQNSRASGRQEAAQQTVKALGVLCCAFCYIALCALMLAAARRKLSQARELVKAKCLKSVGLKAGARFYRGKKTRGRQAVILRQGMAAGERTRGSKPALAK